MDEIEPAPEGLDVAGCLLAAEDVLVDNNAPRLEMTHQAKRNRTQCS
jgi:hypothetical protein